MKEYFPIRRRDFRARKIHPILRRLPNGPTLEGWWNTGQEKKVERRHHEVWSGSEHEARKYLISSVQRRPQLLRGVLLESFCFSHLDFTSSPLDPPAWSISHPVKSKQAEFPTAQYSIPPVVSHRRHWMINIRGKISSNVYNKLI